MGELLEAISQLLGLPATYATAGLILTAGVMLVLADWRLTLLALAVQYLLVGALLSQELLAQVAVVKVLVGGVVCTILYATAVRVNWGAAIELEPPPAEKRRLLPTLPRVIVWEVFPVELPFRLFVILLGLAGAYGLAQGYPLPGLSLPLNLSFYWLTVAGFFLMALCREPYRIGLGLFTLLTGFELFYIMHERSLVVMGLLGAVQLMAALAISYLALIDAMALEESGGEEAP